MTISLRTKLDTVFIERMITLNNEGDINKIMQELTLRGQTLEGFKREVWIAALVEHLERCPSKQLKRLVNLLFERQITPLQQARYHYIFPDDPERAITHAVHQGLIPGPVTKAKEDEYWFKLANTVNTIRTR